MSPEKKEIVFGWYEKADQDILAAEIAFLAFNELFPPKVHDLRQ